MESTVGKGETEVSAGKLDIPICFEMLYESGIQIGDSCTSSHSTNKKMGAVKERKFGSASLGHTGKSVKETRTIDVSG